MVIGICRVELTVYDTASLKEKRSVLKSVIQRLRDIGSLSVAEVGYQDKWQRSLLGVVTVAAEANVAHNALEKGLKLLEREHRIEVVKIDQELEHVHEDSF